MVAASIVILRFYNRFAPRCNLFRAACRIIKAYSRASNAPILLCEPNSNRNRPKRPRAAWYTQGDAVLAPPVLDAASSPAAMPWPDAVGYREAVQNPQTSLAPPELRTGAVSLDRRGLPVAYSGRFAVVFRVVETGGAQWAVRCFTAPPQNEVIARTDRYRLIASHVSELGDMFVPFKYFEQGIRVGAGWFPVVAMRWATGETLGKFTDRNLQNGQALRDLAGTLTATLKKLEDAGISHGDWQHDNLLVSQDGKHVTLVDYDGMYVPEFGGLVADEMGHANYQHPARTALDFGERMDRFACLSMQSALLALSHEPTLWNRFSDGESLLFKKIDFQDPAVSPVFRALWKTAEEHDDELLLDSLARLEEACRVAPDAVREPAVPALESAFAQTVVADWDTLPTTATVLVKATAKGGTVETLEAAQTGGAKWWQAGAPVTLPPVVAQTAVQAGANGKWFAAGTGKTPAVLGGAGRAQAVKAVETWAFIERVFQNETLAKERKHFLMSRAGMTVLAAFTVLFLLSLFGRGGSFPFYLFLLGVQYRKPRLRQLAPQKDSRRIRSRNRQDGKTDERAARKNRRPASGICGGKRLARVGRGSVRFAPRFRRRQDGENLHESGFANQRHHDFHAPHFEKQRRHHRASFAGSTCDSQRSRPRDGRTPAVEPRP